MPFITVMLFSNVAQQIILNIDRRTRNTEHGTRNINRVFHNSAFWLVCKQM